jgi:hypothetical protein
MSIGLSFGRKNKNHFSGSGNQDISNVTNWLSLIMNSITSPETTPVFCSMLLQSPSYFPAGAAGGGDGVVAGGGVVLFYKASGVTGGGSGVGVGGLGDIMGRVATDVPGAVAGVLFGGTVDCDRVGKEEVVGAIDFSATFWDCAVVGFISSVNAGLVSSTVGLQLPPTNTIRITMLNTANFDSLIIDPS